MINWSKQCGDLAQSERVMRESIVDVGSELSPFTKVEIEVNEAGQTSAKFIEPEIAPEGKVIIDGQWEFDPDLDREIKKS